MKTNTTRRDESGAVMLTTALCISAVITLLVVGYLWLLMGHSRRVQESQRWNQAMAVAEAGVEEAMAQLNWGPIPGRSDLSANGWSQKSTSTPGVDTYGPPGERTLSGGSYYSSFIAPAGGNVTNGSIATIYSTGLVTAPITGTTISRRVQVIVTMIPLFHDAVDVVSNFTGNGSSIATDSWDSQSTNLSVNGMYSSSKTSTNGSLGAEYGTVNLGQHTIEGNMYLGPDATNTGSGKVTGTTFPNYNIQFPDAELPEENWQDAVMSTTAIIPTNGTTLTTNFVTDVYNFTNSGTYRITSAGGMHPIYVAPGKTVLLDVQLSTFDMTQVTVLGGINNSGTVYMYQESGSVSWISGNTSVGGYRPENFVYFGLPGVTALNLSGDSEFVGVIYAPEATLNVKGGGNASGVAGAVVCQSVTLSGHYDFHYDQSLLMYGPSRGFVPTSWREF